MPDPSDDCRWHGTETERADLIEMTRAYLRFLSPAERLAVFERFCHRCGYDWDGCRCDD